jgi:hypothetical protein
MKSIETRHVEARERMLRGLANLDRRSFLKVSAAAFAAAATRGVAFPHSFQPVRVTAQGAGGPNGQPDVAFRFAYISDSHLYEQKINDRFVRSLLRAVDDVNAMDPQPDFVFYGGDLAQLGQKTEIELGAQILKALKAPVKMMVGEHDWYLDMGEKWRELFGPDRYSWDHKGVHFVVLNSVIEKDFWTARGMTPAQRMNTVAGLDNGIQSRFEVGDEQRAWLQQDLQPSEKQPPTFCRSRQQERAKPPHRIRHALIREPRGVTAEGIDDLERDLRDARLGQRGRPLRERFDRRL